MLHERDALLFEESGGRQTGIEVTPAGAGPAAQSSETMSSNTSQGAAAPAAAAAGEAASRPAATRIELQRFCAAIRVGTPLACGPEKAFGSARACIRANEAIKGKTRLTI